MRPADWDRLSGLLQEALGLDPPRRARMVEELGREHPALARRLVVLLEEWEDEGTDSPALELLSLDLPALSGPTGEILRWIRQEPEVGEAIGRYQVTGMLGRGGTGAVYLARDPLLERDVALKFLPVGLGTGTEGADPAGTGGGSGGGDGTGERLLREARAASALDHPHISTIYEVARDARGRSYLAMAAHPGGSLRDRLEEGPVPVPEAVRIAREVADALAAAHGAGILHRDVKPENVVFDARGRVRVVDFGIAWMRGQGEGNRWADGGTSAYMAPERLDGAEPDESADVWATAAVLYEMLTGARPWDASSRADLRQEMASPPAPPHEVNPEVPPALSALLLQALSPDPDHRPPSAAAFREALPDPGVLLTGGRGRRASVLALAVAGAGLLVVGGFLGQSLPRVVEARGAAGEAFSAQGRVLVADFQAAGESSDLALVVREALVVDLQQSPHVSVVTRADVTRVLDRLGFAPGTELSGEVAREVAERLGAGAVVQGTVGRAGGGRVLLAAQAVAPVDGAELFSVRASAGERRLLSGVERLSREVRGRLGETAGSLARSRPLPDVTTTSLEALRLYAEAERTHTRDPVRTRELLEAAVALDSTFAMAHRLAAVAALGELRYADVARHLARAWESRDRLPELERWHLEAVHASEVRFDPIGAETIYRRILTRYPGDVRAAVNLGSVRISWMGDPAGAWEGLEAAIARDPDNAALLLRGVHTAAVLGRMEEADAIAGLAEEHDLVSLSSRWPALRSFATGDYRGGLALCLEVAARELPPMTHATDDEICGSMAVAAGDWATADLHLGRAFQDYRLNGLHRNVAHVGQALAMAAIYRGDTAQAESWFLETLDHLPAEGFPEPDRFITRTNLQVHAALVGLEHLVPRIGDHYPAYPDPDHWFGQGGEAMVRAAVALGRGDGEEALAELREAFPPGHRAIGWRIYEETLLAGALEAVGDLEGAHGAWNRAAEPGWLTFPFLTKDRILLPLALAGIERTSPVDIGATGDMEAAAAR